MDGNSIGRYRLIRHIASGGMADVYRAIMTGPHDFEKLVAVKMIHEQLTDDTTFVRMFTDEARLSARLMHPNIVQIIDFGEAGKRLYIAMEYVNGVDLSAFIKALIDTSTGPMVDLSVYIVIEILKALDYTRKLRDADGKEYTIVHRDITPQNILLSYDGDVKLTDFGIAKVRGSIVTTTAGTLKGKIRYMSPEQARGEMVDHRSDLYSLALVLYELITHQRAYAGDTDMALLKQVQSSSIAYRPLQINPAIPEGLDNIVMKALSQKPDDRFYEPASLKDMLEPYAGNIGSMRESLSGCLQKLFNGQSREVNSPLQIIYENKQNRKKGKKAFLYAVVIFCLAAAAIYVTVFTGHKKSFKAGPALSHTSSPPRSPLPEQKVFPPAKDAVLVINAVPWAHVYIYNEGQKRFIGETPIKALRIPAGTYTLVFENKIYGGKKVMITVLPGERKIVILKYDQAGKRFSKTIG
ncbi:MAG: serine/threonine protein kinase [Deltaproteobacteria bacterium]|nr:serine/threonine protein kinase [Deltaproteobacteria bacterium]MCL5276920.1 serine/threonine protein kinase [Deltaproteobacteria bacterium]